MNKRERRRQAKRGEKQKTAARELPPEAASPPVRVLTILKSAIEAHQAGHLDEAEHLYRQILEIDPGHANANHFLGVIAHHTGRGDEAAQLIAKAIETDPANPSFHFDLGNVLKALGRLDAAAARHREAIRLRPDMAEAHTDLGLVLDLQGLAEEAAACHREAIHLKPDYAQAHNNLGIALQDLGRLDEAVASYCKALTLMPDYVEAHSNLGIALQDMGKLDEAMASYHKALAIKPDYAEAHYNLHALLLNPGDMTPSIKCMERAVEINPDKTFYRFILGMLLDYSGNPQAAATHFDKVESGENSDRANLDAWRYIKSANKKIPPIIGSNIQAFKLGINAAAKDGLVLEFGVRFGTSIRQIAALVDQEVHGFDSFEGLPEAWHHLPKGSYSTKGVIPSVQENVILHIGLFEETLPGFVEKFQDPIRFINIDCDTFSSTKTVLDFLAGQITHGTVIVFDEYIGNENWREDEFKAFQEAVLRYDWEYEYLCFSFMTKQVVVRIN